MDPEPGHEYEKAQHELASSADGHCATADQFWAEVERVLSGECETHVHIDDALRSFLALLDEYRAQYVPTEDELGHCAYLLYASPLFAKHAAYIRLQLVYALLQDDDPNTLRVTATFLLAEARENEQTFELLNKEGVFPRLVELVKNPAEHEEVVHRILMELMYEMSRIQRITADDLSSIDDGCVKGLFDLIEQASDDVDDPYHYPVIRVLLVLNEQFMVAAHDPAIIAQKAIPLTNKVVKVLSSHGSSYKTFGANIILLLNREDETSLQLLTLKLLYLLFTTPPTYEYFYTNDLRVLVDILIRNLHDLPEYAAALRHTYLRVLYPLLEHTQLQYPPYYKREEIRNLLSSLTGDHVDDEHGHWNHFEDVDETTKRLVRRCQTVSWLSDPETGELVKVESPIDDKSADAESPTSPSKPKIPPTLPAPRKLKKRDSSKASTLTIGGLLTPQIESARHSSLSVVEIAAQKEKPGVITPSRNSGLKHGVRLSIPANKEKPPPPKARRSGFMRPHPQHQKTEMDVLNAGAPEALIVTEEPAHDVEQYQDALETQLSKTPSPAAVIDDQHPSTTTEGTDTTLPAESPTHQPQQPQTGSEDKPAPTKKPPPAPKTRRAWRGFRNKVPSPDAAKPEPGKFSSVLPSITTTNVAGVEQSPFSPTVAELNSTFSPLPTKTLAPESPFSNGHAISANASTSPDSSATAPQEKRSISEALKDAQAQAVQAVQQTLEDNKAGASDRQQSPQSAASFPARTSSLPTHDAAKDVTVDTVLRSEHAVLAPPSQAPIRGVPGPRVDLERSPFLSEEDELAAVEEEPN